MKVLFLLLIFLSSCASQNDRPVPQSGEELLDEFGLAQEDKARFSFAEVTPTPAPAPVVRESEPAKNKKNVAKEIKKKEQEKKKIEPPVVVAVVATPKAIVKKSWPEDYPEELKLLEAPARKTWNQFKPLIRVGETLKFTISYLGITAGTITFKVLENGKRGEDLVHHFKATLSSADYYKYIYKLDDYVESFVMAESFMPLKYTLIQRESGQSVDELQLFDHDHFQNKQWFKKIKDNKTKKDDKVGFVPPLFLDPLSLLSFFRGLPLKNGDEYLVPIVLRSKTLRVDAKVEKRESIEVGDKNFKAIKIAVVAESSEKGKKPTVMNLWYTDSDTRELLRFNAVLKFGSIEGELVL